MKQPEHGSSVDCPGILPPHKVTGLLKLVLLALDFGLTHFKKPEVMYLSPRMPRGGWGHVCVKYHMFRGGL